MPSRSLSLHLGRLLVKLATAVCMASSAFGQTPLSPGLPQLNTEAAAASKAVKLRQPAQQPDDSLAVPIKKEPAAELYVPGEFERYVQDQVGPGAVVRRLGSELLTDAGGHGGELSTLVPGEYIVAPGDEVLVSIWGTVDADLRLTVDKAGRISIPRVGTVQVAGTRYADLPETVNRRIGTVFRGFQSSVTLGQLRGIRVFVTGFVTKPGAYTVTSLSTVVSALMQAGGPSAAGSFRNIELRRGGTLVGRFDLYDLLLQGDRSADRIVQAGDVVHVGAVGTQVGFIGSVNKPGVLELKAGETIGDALRMAGGFSAVADRSRLAIERLRERSSGRVAQLNLPQDIASELSHGDVVRAFSAVVAQLPSQKQNKRVRVEGEVTRPSEYVLPEGSSINDAIRAAGGYTNAAYVFAAEFTRVSVQRTQQENYDRALRDLESNFFRNVESRSVGNTEDAISVQARSAGASRLIERLRALRPSGRIVLQMTPQATELPDLALEDGDRIFIPARPSTVGVFGSVFNAASYLYLPGRNFNDYLRLAGGMTKGADEGSVFVIRANGNVVSGRQRAGLFSAAGDFYRIPAEPGDTLFVPEELDRSTFTQLAKEWTQVLFQFGLGIAGIKSAIQ